MEDKENYTGGPFEKVVLALALGYKNSTEAKSEASQKIAKMFEDDNEILFQILK